MSLFFREFRYFQFFFRSFCYSDFSQVRQETFNRDRDFSELYTSQSFRDQNSIFSPINLRSTRFHLQKPSKDRNTTTWTVDLPYGNWRDIWVPEMTLTGPTRLGC